MEGYVSSTRGGKKGSGQLVVGSDVFDLLDHIHQSPNHWRDSPITQNSAERAGGEEDKDMWERQKEKTREERRKSILGLHNMHSLCGHFIHHVPHSANSSTVML